MIEFILYLFSLIIICIGLILLFISWTLKDKKSLNKNNQTSFNIAIIIPARDESKVISSLLKSIKGQTVKINSKDVYIVVEDLSDPTCLIAKENKMNIVLRRDLSKKRKGYALDDAFYEIKNTGKDYDLYFIFDADNILKEDYIEQMLTSYKEGYDIAVGYRNTKNGNDTVVAAASSLTFTMINTMLNKAKSKKNLGVTISGTGFYMSKKVVEKLEGYPFHTLTEDYELSIYSILKNIKSTYNEKAIFYDEQPTDYKVTIIQRTRWIRGYLDVRKKYHFDLKQYRGENKNAVKLERIGVLPYLIMVIGIFLFLLCNLIFFFVNILTKKLYLHNLINILVVIFIIYFILCLITLVMLKKEKEYFGLTKEMKIKAIFYNPIFLAGYVPCAIKALCSPNLTWEKIEHNKGE